MLYCKYTEFVTVTIKHSYYKAELSRDFTFTPFPSTMALLKGFGLIPKVVDGQLMLYRQLDKNNMPEQPIDKITDLFFTARVTSDILNITTNFKPGKYWLSNLNEDGTYSDMLTVGQQLGVEDTIPTYDNQKTRIYFKKGTIKEIKVKKIFYDSGKQDVETYTIDADSMEQEIKVTEPGLYYIEKSIDRNTIETKMILHDELKGMGDFWAVLHLQLKPGDASLKLSLELAPLKRRWQYILVEPENRSLSFKPENLAFIYSRGTSRYQVDVNFKFIKPGSYQPILKKHVDAIKLDKKIKEVYVFESDQEMELFDGPSPAIEIRKSPVGTDVLAKNISIPTRAMKETKILYKL